MVDFCDMTEFFCSAMSMTNPVITSAGTTDQENAPEEPIFKLIVETFTKLGNMVLNEDPVQTELFFLEYTLDDLLPIMVANEKKRNSLSTVLYSFCVPSPNAHLRLLNRLKTKIGSTEKDTFVSIVNDLLEMDELAEDDQYLWGSPEMYEFYFDVA